MAHDPPTPAAADHPTRLTSMWDEFCDSLKAAGHVLERASTPVDEGTLAEAHRYLLRMVRVGFENALELADPARPCLVPMVGPTVQYEGVTSDARYLHAFIDGRGTHRITGTRGDAPWMEIGVYTGKMGMHDQSHLLTSLTEDMIEVDADGRIHVLLGPARPGTHRGSWIGTDERTRYLMVRQYADDWTGLREAQLAIERLDGGDSAPLGLDTIREALARTATFARDNPAIWAGISDYWKDLAPNCFVPELAADERTDIAPPSGHQFSCGYFLLEPGRALDIRFRPEGAAFWSLGLANYWYETIGYGRRTSHLNSGNATRQPDGSIRAVISLERPPPRAGIANWIDPRDHHEGTMVFRWSRSRQPVPEIDCQLTRLDAL